MSPEGSPPWGRGRRPPWWPADAGWPPAGDAARRRGLRIARRVGCAVALALLVVVGALAALVWLVLSAFGVTSLAPASLLVAAAAVLFGFAAIAVAVAAYRRVAPSATRLIEGARRVEAGDFSTRVPERGPADLRALARAFNAMSGRLEAEDTRRRSVLADVAHELRTPLTIIRSQAEAIADGVYPADAEHMAPIVAASESLELLVDDLRTLTLAEAGSLQLHREQIDLGVLVNETLDAFRAEAAEGGVELREAVAADLPPVDADPARLRGVLGNLIRNALAHTPRGGTVTVEGAGSDGMVQITVRDTGAGIPEELLPRVFDRFVKGAVSSGSGLGLAIVRDVVEAHGGSVSAESAVGRGTAIRVSLPRG